MDYKHIFLVLVILIAITAPVVVRFTRNRRTDDSTDSPADDPTERTTRDYKILRGWIVFLAIIVIFIAMVMIYLNLVTIMESLVYFSAFVLFVILSLLIASRACPQDDLWIGLTVSRYVILSIIYWLIVHVAFISVWPDYAEKFWLEYRWAIVTAESILIIIYISLFINGIWKFSLKIANEEKGRIYAKHYIYEAAKIIYLTLLIIILLSLSYRIYSGDYKDDDLPNLMKKLSFSNVVNTINNSDMVLQTTPVRQLLINKSAAPKKQVIQNPPKIVNPGYTTQKTHGYQYTLDNQGNTIWPIIKRNIPINTELSFTNYNKNRMQAIANNKIVDLVEVILNGKKMYIPLSRVNLGKL